MYRLLEFLRSIYVAVLFVVIEAAAIGYYARSTSFTQARILTRSNAVAGELRGVLRGVTHFFRLPAENRALLERVTTLENELALRRENALNVHLDTLRSEFVSQYRYVSSRVVGNSVNRPENFVVLNRGLRDEVTPDMAVVTPEGAMVGYVVDCSDRYAVAISVLNTAFRASGCVEGDDHFGSIVWDGTDPRRVEMRELSKYADIHVGDRVVTTGFSLYFPEGVLIGEVERFALNDTHTSYDVEIRLAADMTALGDVLLVENRDAAEQRQLLEQAAAR